MSKNEVPINFIAETIKQFEIEFQKKVDLLKVRLDTEKNSASEYYIADMNGYYRGLVEMGNRAITHFKTSLIKK